MTALSAYIGRDNEERLELLQDGALVTAGAVTRAVFRFGSWCLDTDEDPTLIYFADSDSQVLCFKLGLISDITGRGYEGGRITNGKLTIYDAVNTNGIAWGGTITVAVNAWAVCST